MGNEFISQPPMYGTPQPMYPQQGNIVYTLRATSNDSTKWKSLQ